MSELDFSHISPDQLQAALDQPALIPPEGVIPNFEHPHAENTVALFTLIICLSLAMIASLIRFYVRFIKLRKVRIGDYLMIPGYVFFVLVVERSLGRIDSGPGLFVHQWDKQGKDMASYLLRLKFPLITKD
ncbi:hypothetical protein GGS20DRAFT_591918 [Poronia punctata]|nr:hypothetical protein GGS20DRAFT_591918 [Poronia punctata]